MELVEQLRKDGTDKGLCQLWQKKLTGTLSIKRLIHLYIRGIDFCIKHDYPTLDFIRQNFKGKCEEYGVFVDENIGHQVNRSELVLNGSCTGEIECNGYDLTSGYVRHDSKVNVCVSGNAIASFDVFDNAHLDVRVYGSHALCCVYVYGNATVKATGNVKITYKNTKTY